jgi:hypothetical protein
MNGAEMFIPLGSLPAFRRPCNWPQGSKSRRDALLGGLQTGKARMPLSVREQQEAIQAQKYTVGVVYSVRTWRTIRPTTMQIPGGRCISL